MKRVGQITLILLFLGIIFILPIATKLQTNQAISQVENRKLAEAPKLDRISLLSGEYFGKWEVYLSDHIYGRNTWIKSYTFMNMMVLGKSNINNIVIGKRGFLLPYFAYNSSLDNINEKNINQMTEQLKDLQAKLMKAGSSFVFVGIPSQSSYHRNDYPKQLQNNAQLIDAAEKQMFGRLDGIGIPYINMNTIFHQTPETEFYYKTDHHFNFEGAYVTYNAIINHLRKSLDIQIPPALSKDALDIEVLSNPFGGSRNRQIYFMVAADEKIQIAYPKLKIPYEKFVNGKQDNRLYYTVENKNAMINYGVYMGGDWAETVVKTHNNQLPNLLVFGDSFTNAIEPLLYYHFNETRILDLRHYNKMSLYEYIDQYKPDVVLMLRDDLNYGNLEGNGDFEGKNVKK